MTTEAQIQEQFDPHASYVECLKKPKGIERAKSLIGHARNYARSASANDGRCGSIDKTLREAERQLAAHQSATEQMKPLQVALGKINDIRNSIIGYQSINWSAHIYPLVAALEEAGFAGEGYDEARAKAKTQLDRIAELEAQAEQMKPLVEAAYNAIADEQGPLGKGPISATVAQNVKQLLAKVLA